MIKHFVRFNNQEMMEIGMVVVRVLGPILSDMKSEIQKCRKATELAVSRSATHLSGVFQKHNIPVPCQTKEDLTSLNNSLGNKQIYQEVVSH